MDWLSGIVGFGAGIIFTWWTFIFAFCGCLWCEHRESGGWAIFWAIILGAAAYGLFNLTWSAIWPYLLGYIPVGFVWSFWRWRRHVNNVAEELEEMISDVGNVGTFEISNAKREMDISQKKETVVYWVIMWPFSLIEQSIGDVIDIIEKTILRIADATYNKISRQGLARVENIERSINRED